MYFNQKISIYRSIIQYLLDATRYSLHQIATLSNSSVYDVMEIYFDHRLPAESEVGLNLLKFFHLFVGMEHKGEWNSLMHQFK